VTAALPITTIATPFAACGLLWVEDPDIDAKRPLARPPEFLAASTETALAALHPDERIVAEGLAPARRRDWIAGRAALRALFCTLEPNQLPAPPLASNDRGAPMAPPGWVASISHKRGLAAVMLAQDSGYTIGIDVELAAPTRVDLAARILTDAERSTLLALSPQERGRRVTLAFAVKEAVYKAIDPVVRRHVGFREVELAIAVDGSCTVRPLDRAAIPLAIEAHWQEYAGFWLCTARARRM